MVKKFKSIYFSQQKIHMQVVGLGSYFDDEIMFLSIRIDIHVCTFQQMTLPIIIMLLLVRHTTERSGGCGVVIQFKVRDNCPKFQGDVETIWLHLSKARTTFGIAEPTRPYLFGLPLPNLPTYPTLLEQNLKISWGITLLFFK